MLPMTLQFLIVMIAAAIDDRLQRKLELMKAHWGSLYGCDFFGTWHLAQASSNPKVLGRSSAHGS